MRDTQSVGCQAQQNANIMGYPPMLQFLLRFFSNPDQHYCILYHSHLYFTYRYMYVPYLYICPYFTYFVYYCLAQREKMMDGSLGYLMFPFRLFIFLYNFVFKQLFVCNLLLFFCFTNLFFTILVIFNLT